MMDCMVAETMKGTGDRIANYHEQLDKMVGGMQVDLFWKC